jgi:ParB family chromosome partitioning protein
MNTMQDIEDFNKAAIVPGSVKGGMAALNSGRRDLWQVEPSKLRVIPGFNPRIENEEYEAHIEELKNSIMECGFYQDQPLGGYAAKENDETIIYVYSGHSRLQAVKRAIAEGSKIAAVPVVVSSTGMSMEDLTVALLRGNTGKPLTYYESAVVCSRLQKFGYDVDQIAKVTGMALGVIKNRLLLMSAPLKVRMLVANGVIAGTLAIEMYEEHGENVSDKIDEAVEASKASGKNKLRKSAVPDPLKDLDKRIKKSAHLLLEILKNVRQDAGYMSLTVGNREYIEKTIDTIEPPKADESKSSDDGTDAGGVW